MMQATSISQESTGIKKNGKIKHSYKQKYECLMNWRVQQKIFSKKPVEKTEVISSVHNELNKRVFVNHDSKRRN